MWWPRPHSTCSTAVELLLNSLEPSALSAMRNDALS